QLRTEAAPIFAGELALVPCRPVSFRVPEELVQPVGLRIRKAKGEVAFDRLLRGESRSRLGAAGPPNDSALRVHGEDRLDECIDEELEEALFFRLSAYSG